MQHIVQQRTVQATVVVKLFTAPDGQPGHFVEVILADKAMPPPEAIWLAICALTERLARRIW